MLSSVDGRYGKEIQIRHRGEDGEETPQLLNLFTSNFENFNLWASSLIQCYIEQTSGIREISEHEEKMPCMHFWCIKESEGTCVNIIWSQPQRKPSKSWYGRQLSKSKRIMMFYMLASLQWHFTWFYESQPTVLFLCDRNYKGMMYQCFTLQSTFSKEITVSCQYMYNYQTLKTG